MLLQAMLGLQQDAPRGKLYVDPALPDWLPDVTLDLLICGWSACCSMISAFWRGRKGHTLQSFDGQARLGGVEERRRCPQAR